MHSIRSASTTSKQYSGVCRCVIASQSLYIEPKSSSTAASRSIVRSHCYYVRFSFNKEQSTITGCLSVKNPREGNNEYKQSTFLRLSQETAREVASGLNTENRFGE